MFTAFTLLTQIEKSQNYVKQRARGLCGLAGSTAR